MRLEIAGADATAAFGGSILQAAGRRGGSEHGEAAIDFLGGGERTRNTTSMEPGNGDKARRCDEKGVARDAQHSVTGRNPGSSRDRGIQAGTVMTGSGSVTVLQQRRQAVYVCNVTSRGDQWPSSSANCIPGAPALDS